MRDLMQEELSLSGQRIDIGKDSVAWGPCHIGSSTEIGASCSIGSLAHIGRNVKIGNNCRIQGGAYIADGCILADNVFIGPNATLLNDKYPPSKNPQQWQIILIENNAVVGGGATIVPGCSIGHSSVLGAGSTLTKSIPQGEVWAGNPAVHVMSRKEYDVKQSRRKIESQGSENDG
ncbi:MAG: N-acetyltransferase [Candidatus Poseidoniales archaeon]|nr:MAG: N-acetyltransferase [Candidatus Poseidoniales archaeon]